MEIRKIEPRDFVKVAQLENENWTLASTPHVMDSSAEKIIGKIMTGTTYFLAVENDEILGILDYGPRHKSEFGRHTVTFGIMTAQEARGKGVATTLINFFIDFAKKEGFKKITIQVMGSNPAVLKLYNKLGFVEEGRLKKEFFIDGEYIDDCILAFYLDTKPYVNQIYICCKPMDWRITMAQNLARRMRPRNIDEIVGQKHLVGKGKIIRRMVETQLLSSMILYGPPGIGKTSIASAIAGTMNVAFRTFNATTDTKKRLQEIASEAEFSGQLVFIT